MILVVRGARGLTPSPMLLAVMLGCGPVVACGPTAMSQDPSGSSDTTGSTGPLPTSDPTPTPATRGDTTASTGADDTGAMTSAGFIDDPQDVGPDFDCSVWAQDCPAGHKCTPWASDGGGVTTSYRCVPIVDDPAQTGEPCVVEGDLLSGLDTCDLGMYCFNVDFETREGTCYDLCIGSDAAPSCSNPDSQCRIVVDGTDNLCYPKCDPVAQDCAAGEGCYPLSSLLTCIPRASDGMGAPGDPCEFINVCDPGNFCSSPALNTVTCLDQGAVGCCIPFCDVDAPACAPGESCVPWFEEGSEQSIGYEHVGFCSTM